MVSMGAVQTFSPFEYLQDTKMVIRAGLLWWGRKLNWKMATVFLRAEGMKQPQNLLLTSLLLWLSFGKTVHLCHVL